MRKTQPRSLHRHSLALALAALLANAAVAAPARDAFDDGPLASLHNGDMIHADPLHADGAPDRLEPGEFQWLPVDTTSTGSPVLVMVSIKDQRAYVYRDGQPIAVTTVSTGRSGHDTPTGVFEILQKKKVHHSNRYKDNRGQPAAMPFMQRLTWYGIALHAGRVMAEPASHGCIRLPPKFAEQLYRITEHGGSVVISEDSSVYSLAQVGVDMQLAESLSRAIAQMRLVGSLVADRDDVRENSAGGEHAAVFNP